MPQTLSKALRIRLVHSEHLMSCLEDAHWISGLRAVFIAPKGEVLSAYPRKWIEPLCALFLDRSGDRRSCAVCERVLAGREIKDPCGGTCPIRLKELSYDLRVEDQLVGRFSLGHYREDHAGIDACRECWIAQAREGVALSWNEWKAAWDRTPSLHEKQVHSLHRWLRLAVEEVLRELNADPRLRGKEKTLPGLVHRACLIVKEKHNQPLRLSEVAKACGVSAEHLSRVFHQSTGVRFREYLAEVRLNEACRLLLESDLRIAEIAEQVGQPSLSRFNHSFKNYTGIPPREWRQRARRTTGGEPFRSLDGV